MIKINYPVEGELFGLQVNLDLVFGNLRLVCPLFCLLNFEPAILEIVLLICASLSGSSRFGCAKREDLLEALMVFLVFS